MNNHYYECHVTIDPSDEVALLSDITKTVKFKLAQLFMKKGETLEPSDIDMFMTGHSKDYDDLHKRMSNLVATLTSHKFVVRRFKIESVLLDSRLGDTL